jgi:hypothetical protein
VNLEPTNSKSRRTEISLVGRTATIHIVASSLVDVALVTNLGAILLSTDPERYQIQSVVDPLRYGDVPDG